MKILSRIINRKNPFIIAEISGNHNGSYLLLKKTVLAAKKCGVDAIKLQFYSPEDLTLNVKKKDFLIKNVDNKWRNKYLYEIYNKGQTLHEWHKKIFKYCNKIGIICFSSPFSEEAVDKLEQINCPAYKIASLEITNLGLLKKISRTKKPVFISTGASKLKEIKNAVKIFKNNKNIVILRCTVDYPCKISDVNLNSLITLKNNFKTFEVGYSDHTVGSIAATTAISIGASVIEKHFIYDKKIKSIDNFFSMDRFEMKNFVERCREVPKLLGTYEIKPTKNELNSLKYRRSIFVSNTINKGEIFTNKNIKVVRPASGTPLRFYDKILGSVAKKNYKIGDKIKF
jgi:pseudaminic acid synthase